MWRSLDGLYQGFTVANKHDLLNSARQGRVNESAIEQPAPHYRDDHALKLASLSFVNGDRVGEFDAVQRISSKPVHDTVEVAIDGLRMVPLSRALHNDPADASQTAIEQSCS